MSEDPLVDVPNLPGGVAQQTMSKYVSTENLHQVVEHLVERGSIYGHALRVQAGTGWHTQELMRSASSGRVDPVPTVHAGFKSSKVGAFLGHAEDSRMVDLVYVLKAIPPKAPTPMDDVVEEKPADEPKAPARDEVVSALVAKVESLEREVKRAGGHAERAPTRRRQYRDVTPSPLGATSLDAANREFQHRAALLREKLAALRARLRA